MGYALVTHQKSHSPDGLGYTTPSLDTTGADLLVIVVAAAAITLSDNKGNSYPTPDVSDFTINHLYQFSVQAPVVGTGHTFTITGASAAVLVSAWSGSATSPVDQTNHAGGLFNASGQPGSITPSENNCLIVTGVNFSGTTPGARAINSSFTILDDQEQVNTQATGAGLAYLIQGTASAVNPTWTDSDSTIVGMTIVSYKSATAITREQEGYRFRADDGSESTASWLASQDTDISRARQTNTRIRMLMNATGDLASEGMKLQYRRANGADEWKDVD